jgi:hypothetical protein
LFEQLRLEIQAAHEKPLEFDANIRELDRINQRLQISN